jgi:ribulose-5-phosphate 4-epimerase/fuculose-1-phosphate aldolase
MTDIKLREELCNLAKSLFARNFSNGSTGNISARTEDGGLLVTPTGSSLGSLDPSHLSRLDVYGNLVNGPKPTKEVPLHRAFYETRNARTGAVVHLHSTHSVALSTLPDIDPDSALPPITPYAIMRFGDVKLLPYIRPGDPALGAAVRELCGNYTAVLLANHGPIVAGKDLQSAVYSIEELEETAKLALLTRGLNPRMLTAGQIAELRKMSA